jgi:hypothetical protein
MIKSLFIVALLAAPTTETAPRCITKRQVADATIVLTPIVLEAVTKVCRPALPPQSFLATQGETLVARLKSESAGREASAAQLFTAAMGDELPPIDDKVALVKVVGGMAVANAVKDLKPESCGAISRMIAAVSPLPAENMGMFAASALELAAAQSAALPAEGSAAASEHDVTMTIDLRPAEGAAPKSSSGLGRLKICKE